MPSNPTVFLRCFLSTKGNSNAVVTLQLMNSITLQEEGGRLCLIRSTVSCFDKLRQAVSFCKQSFQATAAPWLARSFFSSCRPEAPATGSFQNQSEPGPGDPTRSRIGKTLCNMCKHGSRVGLNVGGLVSQISN
jgi:hypothetical protein